ncbi:MAG TPA: methyltransferase domain-containing protein [Acidimicrobiia bacterium]|nr:methyltransferase domain-containing protein [Acidimicrobiia bacterium]
MPSASYRQFTGTAAENYQRHFVPAIATPVSADLLRSAGLKPGERVLDVACGTGVTARLAAEQVGATGSVTAIDIAPDMIDVARTVPAPVGPPIGWHVGDATSLPFPDEAYDVVLCQMGLMFMPDRPAVLAELRRVLVPGGRLALNTPGRIHPTFEAMEEAIVEHVSPELGGFVRAVFSMHDPDAVAVLVADARFEDVSAAVSTVTVRLPPPAEFLWQYIHLTPMAPFMDQASPAARSAMEQQVVERWQPWVVDGATCFDLPMVTVTGRR